MDPASHRVHCSHIAKNTKGRCFSIRYRLAPVHPFPSQILDALCSYLYLLAPPEGAFHKPVKPSSIIFAGDSAGGNISLSLLQLLLSLQRQGTNTISYHGKDIPVELPGGLSLLSPWCDIGRTQPSIYRNVSLDYLEPPQVPPKQFPSDDMWPSSPPRLDMYCNATVMAHPLVSPLAVKPQLWHGAPPIFIAVGNETLQDEVEGTARRLYEGGVTVDFNGYEGMPHCGFMIFVNSNCGKHFYNAISQFCLDAIAGKVEKRSTGKWLKAFSSPPAFEELQLSKLNEFTDEEIDSLVHEARDKAIKIEVEMQAEYHAKSKL